MTSVDLQTLADRVDIGELLDRYAATLDESQDPARFDETWARSVFTDDVELSFPVGSREGIDGAVALHRHGMGRFVRTQHVVSNLVLDFDLGGDGDGGGDRVGLRANLLAAHVHANGEGESLFVVGDWYEGEARRTASGWRLGRLALHVVWNMGQPPLGLVSA
jgi:SnoaL-like protein